MQFTGEGVKASAELAQLESLQLHHCGPATTTCRR